MFKKLEMEKPKNIWGYIHLIFVFLLIVCFGMWIISFPVFISMSMISEACKYIGWDSASNVFNSVSMFFAFIASFGSGTIGAL